jgi:hypothetical protein
VNGYYFARRYSPDLLRRYAYSWELIEKIAYLGKICQRIFADSKKPGFSISPFP